MGVVSWGHSLILTSFRNMTHCWQSCCCFSLFLPILGTAHCVWARGKKAAVWSGLKIFGALRQNAFSPILTCPAVVSFITKGCVTHCTDEHNWTTDCALMDLEGLGAFQALKSKTLPPYFPQGILSGVISHSDILHLVDGNSAWTHTNQT